VHVSAYLKTSSGFDLNELNIILITYLIFFIQILKMALKYEATFS